MEMKLQTYVQPKNWPNCQELEVSEVLDKSVVHNKYLFHKSVHLLVLNSRGDICSRKRANSELRYSGMYTSTLGTHVELGLDYFKTLKKHLPLDLKIDLNWIGEFRIQDDFENEVCGLYVAHMDDINLINNNHHFLSRDSLDSNIKKFRVTPHLEEAYSLFLRELR